MGERDGGRRGRERGAEAVTKGIEVEPPLALDQRPRARGPEPGV